MNQSTRIREVIDPMPIQKMKVVVVGNKFQAGQALADKGIGFSFDREGVFDMGGEWVAELGFGTGSLVADGRIIATMGHVSKDNVDAIKAMALFPGEQAGIGSVLMFQL